MNTLEAFISTPSSSPVMLLALEHMTGLEAFREFLMNATRIPDSATLLSENREADTTILDRVCLESQICQMQKAYSRVYAAGRHHCFIRISVTQMSFSP